MLMLLLRKHAALSTFFSVLTLMHTTGCSPAAHQQAATDDWVRFSSFEYRGLATTADEDQPLAPDEFRNPILAGFYPDPSICRAGDNYYLINSSFAYFPGVPIFQSTDLVSWKQIGHILDRSGQLNLARAGVSRGIFAPAISYHDGVFYMITTLVDAGGNFFVSAKDPAGPWSEPIWLDRIDGIDPAIFFDDDGKAYIVHNGPPPGNKSLYNGHRAIWMHNFDVKAEKTFGDPKLLVDGGTDLSKHPIWIEAPHIFKRNGWYYLICAEGGTSFNHSEVVFRTRSLAEPFVPWDQNPILSQRQLDPARPNPVTSAGHADFVQTSNGEWWAVFLATRPYEPELTNIGRETFMLPVRWDNDWPIILDADAIIPARLPRPNLPPSKTPGDPLNGPFVLRDEFTTEQLSPMWMMLRTPTEPTFAIDHSSGIRLKPLDVGLESHEHPSLLLRRQQHANFIAKTTVDLSPTSSSSDAGLVAFHNEDNWFFAGVKSVAGKPPRLFVERASGGTTKATPEAIYTTDPRISATRIHLRLQARGRVYQFSYRTGDSEWLPLGPELDGSILSTHKAGGFVGTCIGIYCRTAR